MAGPLGLPGRLVWPLAQCAVAMAVLSLAVLGCSGEESGCPCEPAPPAMPHDGPVGRVQSLSAGHNNVCAVLEGGFVRCWGDPSYGQIGDGTLAGGRYPTPVVGLPAIHQVAVGSNHVCALSVRGCVWCWGNNDHGQLANDETGGSSSPVLAEGLRDISMISAYGSRETALDTRGAIWSWGSGGSPAVLAVSPSYRFVDTGGTFGCALRDDGRVECWGLNTFGQLGLGDFEDRESPTVVSGLTEVTQLALGAFSSCAVHSDGTVSCWGHNEYGQVGDGTTVHRPDPHQVPLTDVEEVSLYAAHACARTTSGEVWCWGDNSWNQIGNGATEDVVSQPWQIAGIDGVRSVVTGWRFTCVLKNDHDVFCWGYNKHAELGDGTFENSSTPVQVVWDKPEP